MELAKEFGVDLRLLIAQTINFLVILYLLRRYLYKPVLELLKKREETIKEGLAKAQEGQELLDKAIEKEKTILRNAHDQAKEMLLETKIKQQETNELAEKKTKERIERMLKDAQEQIDRETKEAEKRLSTQTSELAAKFLQKSVKGLFLEKEQEQIVKQALKRIRAD